MAALGLVLGHDPGQDVHRVAAPASAGHPPAPDRRDQHTDEYESRKDDDERAHAW
jgi:hypothetical protein